MAKYSIQVSITSLGIYKEVEAKSLEIANEIAIDLAKEKFGFDLDQVVYQVSEIVDGSVIDLGDLNGS